MNSQPKANKSQKAPPPSQEELEEMTEETAKTMDSARRDVARAKETLHDQILADSPSSALESDEGHEPDA